MSDKNLEDRIVELEVRLSFQSETIEALNSVINEQQAKIKSLEKRMEAIERRLPEPEGYVDPTRVRPPHY